MPLSSHSRHSCWTPKTGAAGGGPEARIACFTLGSAATSNADLLNRLVNDLVGTAEDRGRDGKAERSRGIEIDDQPEFTGRLDRQIGGMRAVEDLIDVTRRAAEQIAVIGGERDQTTVDGKDPKGVD